MSLRSPVPPLLRRLSSDEYRPLPWRPADREALARFGDAAGEQARAGRPRAADLRGGPAGHGSGAAGHRCRSRRRLLHAPCRGRGRRRHRRRLLRRGQWVGRDRRADPSREPGQVRRPRGRRTDRVPRDDRPRAVVRGRRPGPHLRRRVGGTRLRRQRDGRRPADVAAGAGARERPDQRRDRGLPGGRRSLRGHRQGAHPHDRPPQLRPGGDRGDAGLARRPAAVRLEGVHAVGPARDRAARRHADGMVPRRRGSRRSVPRAGANPRAQDRVRPQGHRRAGAWRCPGRVRPPRRRAGGGPVPRHHVPRVPLGLRARSHRARRGPTRPTPAGV